MWSAYVDQARLDAEALMVDTFTLARPTGASGYDETSQSEGETTDPLADSLGKLQTRFGPTRGEVGGRTIATVRNELHLPAAAPALTVGDVATLTTLGPSTPTSLLNTKWRVIAPVGKTWATAARYEVEEVI